MQELSVNQSLRGSLVVFEPRFAFALLIPSEARTCALACRIVDAMMPN